MDTVSIPGMSGTLLQALHLVFGFGSYSEAMAPYACHIYIYIIIYIYMMMMKCGTNHSHGLQSLCECWHHNYGMHDLKICSLQLATRSFYTFTCWFFSFRLAGLAICGYQKKSHVFPPWVDCPGSHRDPLGMPGDDIDVKDEYRPAKGATTVLGIIRWNGLERVGPRIAEARCIVVSTCCCAIYTRIYTHVAPHRDTLRQNCCDPPP